MSSKDKDYWETEEAKEKVRKAHEANKKKRVTIDVNIDDKHTESLKKGSDEFNKFRDIVLKKARKVLSEAEIDHFGDSMTFTGLKSIAHASLEREKWLKEDDGSIPSGQIPLSGATGSKDLEFDSQEEMIDFLQREKSLGDKRANLILNELFKKTMTGQRAPIKEMEFKGEKDVEGKEKGLFETMREEFRKRKLAEKKKRMEAGDYAHYE